MRGKEPHHDFWGLVFHFLDLLSAPQKKEARHRQHKTSETAEVLGWHKRCALARAFPWGYGCKRLKLAQLLGQLGVCLTCHVD